VNPRKRWHDLSPGVRRLLLAAGTAEGALKIAALVDIRRRPAAEIRGSKLVWASVVTVVNSFGIAPLVYLRFGRRR
jgi:hypothetical protein